MSNCPKFELTPLEVGPKHIKPVLQCLIHTILFHRALGSVKPREISSDVFTNTSYMTCDKVYEEIEASISQVTKASEQILSNPNGDNHSTVIEIKFYEETKAKNDGFLGFGFWQKELKPYWEIWAITLKRSKKDIDLRSLEKDVRHNMIKIIDFANKHMDHLPRLPNIDDLNKSPVSFPFEIKNPDQKDTGGLSALRMLLKTPPVKT